MKAMRRGAVPAGPAAVAASDAPGSMASSMGSATAVPSPLRKVRRGSCQVLFIKSRADSGLDDPRVENLQKQAGNSRYLPAWASRPPAPRRVWKGGLLTTSRIRLENL